MRCGAAKHSTAGAVFDLAKAARGRQVQLDTHAHAVGTPAVTSVLAARECTSVLVASEHEGAPHLERVSRDCLSWVLALWRHGSREEAKKENHDAC